MRTTTTSTTLCLLLAAALLSGGCGSQDPVTLDSKAGADGGPAEGREGGPCYKNGSCDPGLTCSKGTCVKASGVDLGPLPDLPPVPDGFGPLDPCSTPGKPCSSQNPCAINPVCGADKLCHPAGVQNCDDGLACTTDTCKGLGVCENKPKADTCALVDSSGATPTIKCFNKGDKKPGDSCMVCDPSTDAASWTGANGGACDDGNSCTKDDYCVAGQCKGSYYGNLCDDSYSCTDDLCDGKGGCLTSKLKSDHCLINGACYKDGAANPNGTCYRCDVKTSQSAWTAFTDACQITVSTFPPPPPPPPPLPPPPPPPGQTKCYANGASHPSGSCAACDTSVSKTDWTVKSGCLINSTCYAKGATDLTGCSQCDPATSSTAWTPLTGLCLINSACYKNGDKHNGGCAECDTSSSTSSWTVKSGCLIYDTCYAKGATDLTGCSQCDPATSSTAWTPLTGLCLIDLTCYKNGDKNVGGCAECDTSSSTSSWTVKSGCLIADTCYVVGAKNANGCSECDPTASATSWTPLTGLCQIAGSCYKDGALDASGCGICKPASSSTSWSPVTSATVVSEGFESGAATGWTLTNTDTKVGWQVSKKRPSSGSYALYYGDPVTGNYDSGAQNSGTAAMPAVTLIAGKKAALSFSLWMDVETGGSYDVLEVLVNGTQAWVKSSSMAKKSWQQVTVDLSSYAGTKVTITFKFDTKDAIQNTTEGVHIDDVTILHGC